MENTPPITPERQKLLQGLARQAAVWWRRQLADPGYLGKFQNGDTSRAGETAQIMASLAALRSPGPANEALDRFEQLLAEAVLNWMLKSPSPAPGALSEEARCMCTAEQLAAIAQRPARYLLLSVDYGPEGLLRQVAEEARVSGFPVKTTMWVSWDADPARCHVEVRHGYGAAAQRLSSTPAPC
jgi:hypothetical protein